MTYCLTSSGTNLHISDSAFVAKRNFDAILKEAKEEYPDAPLWKERGITLMKLEWAAHNFCYDINFKRERTKDVDLNCPMKWYTKIAYAVVGSIAWGMIK